MKLNPVAANQMDGVSVAKAIRKFEAAREAYNRRDGRDGKDFPHNGWNMTTAEYVAQMEAEWHLRQEGA